MKTVGTKIDNEEFEKFTEMCLEKGCTRSETLRELIRHYTETGHPMQPKSKEKQKPQLIEIRDIPEDEPKPTVTLIE